MADQTSSAQAGSQANLVADPAWFPDGFDSRRGELLFVRADRAELAAQTFLDWRWKNSDVPRRRENAALLIGRLPPVKPAPVVIWHTGFCCSTLLAKMLDQPGRNLALCEPKILVDVADAKRAGMLDREPLSRLPRLAFQLLARGFARGERVTLKPAPAANVLLREAAMQTGGPMLFLYSDCRSFLISICKLGEEGRKYIRGAFLAILGDGHAQAQWPPGKLLALSDLELAAIVWHMQIAEFLRSGPHFSAGRTASLDCDAFLTSPGEALRRLDEFFSLNLGPDRLKELAEGPLLRRNAKTGQDAFDFRRRREEHAAIAEQLAPDLDRIVAQSYAICGTTPRGAPLPDCLLPVEKTWCP